jgi:hypothetical protein
MTAAKVIEEIIHLPRAEESRVVEFASSSRENVSFPAKSYRLWHNGW